MVGGANGVLNAKWPVLQFIYPIVTFPGSIVIMVPFGTAILSTQMLMVSFALAWPSAERNWLSFTTKNTFRVWFDRCTTLNAEPFVADTMGTCTPSAALLVTVTMGTSTVGFVIFPQSIA